MQTMRTIVNIAGTVYDALKTSVIFAEDMNAIKANIEELAGGVVPDFIASGNLANGDKVVVNADGTVSVIAGVAQNNGTNQGAGFAGSSNAQGGCYDPASGKVVIVGQKNGQASGGGQAVIGTITGVSISFGTPVDFLASWTSDSVVIPIGSSKVMVLCCNYNTSQQGYAIVGTISGTSISFGSAVAFNSGASVNDSISFDWDSGNSKGLLTYRNTTTDIKAAVVTVSGTTITINTAVTIASVSASKSRCVWTGASNVFSVTYYDVTNSKLKSCVGTISGTTVSFGSLVDVVATAIVEVDSIYDSVAGKVVVVYKLNSDNKGYAIIGTISGTSISFGSPVVFCTTTTANISVDADIDAHKIVVTYFNNTNSYFKIGTISGTSISFGMAVSLASGNIAGVPNGLSYCGSNKNFLTNNASGAEGIMFTTAYSNLTSDNYLGIAKADALNTESVPVACVGSITGGQTSLTAGLKYYVDNTGALNTTSTNPYCGLAVSSTEILVKG